MSKKVTNIKATETDSRKITPVECLRIVLDEIEDGELECKKLVLLGLYEGDDDDGTFYTFYRQAGTSLYESVTLLEIAKSDFIWLLNHPGS